MLTSAKKVIEVKTKDRHQLSTNGLYGWGGWGGVWCSRDQTNCVHLSFSAVTPGGR